MKRTASIGIYGLVFLASAACFAASPNFVVIMADDLGIGDVGPYGASLIKTPNLDRMAAGGAILTSFYSSASVCTPSRGGLLTGKYPARMNIVKDVARPTNAIGLAPEEITLAEILKKKGYATACIGKWHLGHRPEHWPTNQGFDYFYGLPYSNDMKPLPLYRGNEVIEEPAEQETLTERYTKEAVGFIEAHKDEPFFVYLPHTMPHVPLHVSAKFEGQSAAGLYGDVVEALDWSIGQVMDTLERLGLDDNTLVLFTSDNGPWWEGSAGAYRNRKGSAWEGGMRVPMVAWWPGTIPPGAVSDAISMNIDVFPTLAKLAGAKTHAVDGRDIFPLFKGGQTSPHEYLYLFNRNQIAAVRSQKWKLVVQSWYRNWNAPLGSKMLYYYPGLLFDMENESPELYSVTRENPAIAETMAQWLEEGKKDILGR